MTKSLTQITLFFATILTLAVSSAAITEDGTYALDKDHAHIGFSVSHLGISNAVGRFNEFDGSMTFVAGGESTVNFSIRTDSVDTNQKRRDKHLRSDDFFDVDNFSSIKFVSTAVTYTEAGDPKTITGDLTLLTETKSVTFDVTAVGAGAGPSNKQRAGYTATTVLKRSEFGMTKFVGIVGEDVTVSVNVEMIKN